MKPIETRYAGHRFRSRLEARWAVFFDALGIRWQYEAEGYECVDRLNFGGERAIRYLPDFWLPELGLWAEVKGAWADEQAAKDWLHCVADLSSNYACPGSPDFRGFLLIGEVGVTPGLFHMHEGSLSVAPWTKRSDERLVAHDVDEWPGLDLVMAIPTGASAWPHRSRGTAVDRARSARFEHGERGR